MILQLVLPVPSAITDIIAFRCQTAGFQPHRGSAGLHLTVIPPLTVSDKWIDRIGDLLQSSCQSYGKLILTDFTCQAHIEAAKSTRVISLRLNQAEAVIELRNRLNNDLQGWLNRPRIYYHPHITLQKGLGEEAHDYVQRFPPGNFIFAVTQLHLLARTNREKPWSVYREISLT